MRTHLYQTQPPVECHTIRQLLPNPNFEIAQCYIYYVKIVRMTSNPNKECLPFNNLTPHSFYDNIIGPNYRLFKQKSATITTNVPVFDLSLVRVGCWISIEKIQRPTYSHCTSSSPTSLVPREI